MDNVTNNGGSGQMTAGNENISYVNAQVLPHSTAILVLGILSLIGCWCYGIIGIILAIIALVLSGKAKRIYDAAPEKYTNASYQNMKAGKICAIIGLCLSGLYLIFVVIYLIFVGTFIFTAMPWDALQSL